MSAINFTGNSEIFYSTKLYKEAAKQAKPKMVGGDFKLKDVKSGKNLASDFANTCTMLLLQANEDQCMFHLAPELQHPDLARTILTKIEHLKQKAKDPITAFINGGQSYQVKQDAKSFNLFDKIAQILDIPDVDLSIIWGKTKDSFADNMFASSKSSKIILGQEKQLGQKEIPKIHSLKDLEENYEIVEINPKHKIIFG